MGRKRNIDRAVVIAAYRRGWSFAKIAFAASVSLQAIQHIVRRYEKEFGKIEQRNRSFERPRLQRLVRCKYCGNVGWEFRPGWPRGYCSKNCSRLARLEVTDDVVEQSIEMRLSGESWAAIARTFGNSQQSIQLQIWKYLYMRGKLNAAIIKKIWLARGRYLVSGRPSSWAWIERRLGLYLQNDGSVVEGTPQEGHTIHAWGELVMERRERKTKRRRQKKSIV